LVQEAQEYLAMKHEDFKVALKDKDLISKGPLSPQRTKWILGRFL